MCKFEYMVSKVSLSEFNSDSLNVPAQDGWELVESETIDIPKVIDGYQMITKTKILTFKREIDVVDPTEYHFNDGSILVDLK